MTTSGSYDKTTTMVEIITDAFSHIGVIDDSQTLPADKYVYGKRKLNELMSLFSTHKGLWLVSDTTVTLKPGTASYTVGIGLTIAIPKPMQVSHARRVQVGGNEISIVVEPREEYMSIPNKTLQAPANCVYYDNQRDSGVLYVWPTGTATESTIIITTQRPIQDFDSEGNNPDLPKEWILCLGYQLATIIAPKYKGGVVPADVKIMADQMMSALMIYDEEKTSVFFA